MEAVRQALLMLLAASSLMLLSCAPPEPVRIGYLAGLSGRVTDLGLGGLNGVRLALEMRNQAGGIKGRPIELVEADDQQDPEIARLALGRLFEQQVQAVVGPMTSDMAVATVPLADQAQRVMISPTVTTNDLTGRDDYFFRVIPQTRSFVKTSAAHHFHTLGVRRIRLVYDLQNRSYSESWRNDFSAAFAEAGGSLLDPLSFVSSNDVDFASLARQALENNPQGIIILGNSVDAAMLCQQIRKLNASVAIGTSEWAATERLIELGGRDVEGLSIAQFIDRFSTNPNYVVFRDAYVRRFGVQPGFPGVLAFDAANVIFDALEQKTADQSLKQVLLSKRQFAGTQTAIRFDDYGDSTGTTFMITVKNGLFAPLTPAH